jgi:hypothetical protein
MNADGLLAVSWIYDLGHHDYAGLGFQLPRIPSLFPDLLLQAGASAVTPSAAWAVFVYNVVQFQLLVLAAAYVGRLLSGASFLSSVTASLVVISAVVLADLFLPGTTGLPIIYFESCLHFGPYIVCLFAAGLAYRLVERWRAFDGGLLFVLSCLAVLSDKLTLINFILPAAFAAVVASWLVWRRLPIRVFGLIGLLAAGAASASALDRLLNRQPDLPIDRHGAPARAAKFLSETLDYLHAGHGAPLLLCVVLPFLVFVAYLFLARRPDWHDDLEPIDGAAPEAGPPRSTLPGFRVDLTTLFLWILAVTAILGSVVATATLAYEDVGSYRYLCPVFVWPLIFCIAALISTAPLRVFIYAIGGAGIAALVMVAGLASAAGISPGPVAWQSKIAQCLVAQKDNLGLKAGFAQYWSSRPTMIAADWRLQVNQASTDGHALLWGNDPYWFVKDFNNPSSPPAYNFIVMTDMDPMGVRGVYGEPSRVYTCADGGPVLWIYGDSARMTKTFLADLQPPDGSFRQNCTDAVQAGPDLLARCLAPQGRRRWTRLADTAQCSGDISDHDGALKAVCHRPRR